LLTKIRTPGRFCRRNSHRIAGRPASENSVKRTCCVFRPPGQRPPPGRAFFIQSARECLQGRARPLAVTGATGDGAGSAGSAAPHGQQVHRAGTDPAAVEQREQPVPRYARGGGVSAIGCGARRR
jgi:hypothetical protein